MRKITFWLILSCLVFVTGISNISLAMKMLENSSQELQNTQETQFTPERNAATILNKLKEIKALVDAPDYNSDDYLRKTGKFAEYAELIDKMRTYDAGLNRSAPESLLPRLERYISPLEALLQKMEEAKNSISKILREINTTSDIQHMEEIEMRILNVIDQIANDLI